MSDGAVDLEPQQSDPLDLDWFEKFYYSRPSCMALAAELRSARERLARVERLEKLRDAWASGGNNEARTVEHYVIDGVHVGQPGMAHLVRLYHGPRMVKGEERDGVDGEGRGSDYWAALEEALTAASAPAPRRSS